MTFAWPYLLWLLIIPASLLVWELKHRRRVAALVRPKILRAETAALAALAAYMAIAGDWRL